MKHGATAMTYLVDTNILVDLTRGHSGAASYLDSLRSDWCISTITGLELLAGARTQRETDALDHFLKGYRVIPPTAEIAERAYGLMKTYARSHGLHPLDALIAATAMDMGFILASRNRKHFQMISGLDFAVPAYQ